MSSIDPGSARTAEDYVLLLRQARAMSELSFWELEQRAEAAGHELEPAVLAETLGLAALPGEDLVVALLHACGHSGDEIEQWLSVRSRLAAVAAAGATQPPAEPAAAGEPAAGVHEQTVVSPAPEASAARPRHTLRVPGRGSRRAPGSKARLLASLAAVIVGAGSIAVIVSAVNHREASGPPVYATGVPPRTAPATQPSPTAEPQTTAAPTATPPPSRSVPPSSTPRSGVLRSGTATLQTGQSIDLDGGASDADIVVFGDGDSIRADPSSRHFATEPTATKQACAAAGSYQKTMQDLAAGNGICVRTDQGRYAHITVTATAPLGFSYVVWS